MLLSGKCAILYGAAGHIGRSVAQVFAREGARLFLTGRDLEPLAVFADELRSSGGRVDIAQVDALDARVVQQHLASVVDQAGGVDIAFNMISLDDVQGQELTAMTLDDFVRPVDIAIRTQFITGTAAARHMVARGRGVIMAITATPARLALPLVGGFGTACSAIEGMLRTLAAEVGPRGVRVVWLRSAGSPESFDGEVAADSEGRPSGLSDDAYLESLRRNTLLKRFPRLAEVGETAALIASDRASAMTGAAANITCGQIVD